MWLRVDVYRLLVLSILLLQSSAWAIEPNPTQEQVQAQVRQGEAFVPKHIPPDHLFAWFGAGVDDELIPKGFVLSKLVGVRVMAAHFGLRGQPLTEADLKQVLDSPTMIVTAFIYGERPNFAVNTYVVMEQAGKSIKPINVRFDAAAARTAVWPAPPAYKAKVVSIFNYADFDPTAKTTLLIYPPSGGEVRFELDFSQID
ncbi:MAG: hypothetical protein U0172_04440 [Nitrospiraceae bacterium]